MPTAAKVLLDSLSPCEVRLSTLLISMPRSVLAEFNTHRMLSRNAMSSRAVPVTSMVRKVFDDCYIPERFSAMGPGMSEAGWLEGEDHKMAVERWLESRDAAVIQAMKLLCRHYRDLIYDKVPEVQRFQRAIEAWKPLSVSVHKQDVNRLLEPFLYVTVVASATCWDNFFALRCDRAAHPGFRKAARLAYLALRRSRPAHLKPTEWHLPFVGQGPLPSLVQEGQPDGNYPLRLSVARCAWTSYDAHDGPADPDKVERVYNKLIGSDPKHPSPLEHQGEAQGFPPVLSLCGNFRSGFTQLRKTVHRENIDRYTPAPEEVMSWEEWRDEVRDDPAARLADPAWAPAQRAG